MSLKDKFVDLFSKEVSNSTKGNHQNDSGDLFILLRVLCLIYVLYYAIQTVLVSIGMGLNSAIFSCVAIILMLLNFIISYFIDQEISLLMLVGLPVIANSVLSFVFGHTFTFHHMIPLGILIIFSSIRRTIPQKFIVSFVLAIYVVVFDLVLRQHVPFYEPNPFIEFVSVQVSMLLICAFLITASCYFCMKFTQAEHKVYIYNRQLKKMASLDPLTNLMNRRGMADVLPDLEYEYNKGNHGFSIAIGDIDFFKHVNDKYGHDCGDYILKSVSEIFARYMEGKGEICRWGGEEFLFAFTERNPDNVFVFLNDLRHTIKHTHFTFNEIDIQITMTFGLEEFSPNSTIESTIKQADEKLYLGKESGRDKVVY